MNHNFQLALVLVFAASCTMADPKKLSKDLPAPQSGGSVNLIVQYNVAPGETQKENVKRHGGRIHEDLKAVYGLRVTLPAAALEDLSDDPDVKYISPDRGLRAQPTIPE